MAFVKLKDWELREPPDLRAPAVAGRAMRSLGGIARRHSSSPSRRRRSSSWATATGFDFKLQDRGGLGHEKLMPGAQPAARAWPPRTSGWRGSGPTGWRTCPQYKVDIDWEKAGALGVPR